MPIHVVTGADGFIGSHLTEYLVNKGHSVRCLSLYNSFGTSGWLDTLSNDVKSHLEIVHGDIRDPDTCSTLLRDASHVYHLAALIGVPYSFTNPISYVQTNINGTLNILQAALLSDSIESLVLTSTSETYGTAQSVPITESHRAYAQSPYAATKIASDQLGLSFYSAFQLPVKILRPFNTFGPRQSARAVIPTIITQLLSKPDKIYLGNLSTRRDFTYVLDTCSAFYSVSNDSNTVGMQLNASSEFEVTIKEILDIIMDITDSYPEVCIDPDRIRPGKSEVERLLGDSSLLRRTTSWRPSYGSLDGFRQALIQTVEWSRSNVTLAKADSHRYTV